MKYVLGLAFDSTLDRIILIEKKNGPATIVNRLNGPGGKIEGGELPVEAMVREFREEVGVNTDHLEWLPVHYYSDPNYTIHVFAIVLDERFDLAHTRETEEVYVVPRNSLKDKPLACAPDLLELINMAAFILLSPEEKPAYVT